MGPHCSLALLLLLVGCGQSTLETSAGEEGDAAAIEAELGEDADRDGIADALELQLALKFAPEVRLHPDDWTRPANVEWYLARVGLRFDHSFCPDHQVLAPGAVTQANLWRQQHTDTNYFCSHSGPGLSSANAQPQFFLEPADKSATHPGTDAAGWVTYVHVRKSTATPGGYDIQYWFFYPYNDAFARFNHEGDWEHITVTVDSSGSFRSARYAQHNGGTRYEKGALSFAQLDHPVVYSANGSHASYPAPGSFPTEAPLVKDEAKAGGPVWRTWERLVHVGERSAPLNGQGFVRFGGRWGEIGSTSITSGPVGPAFQSSWTTE